MSLLVYNDNLYILKSYIYKTHVYIVLTLNMGHNYLNENYDLLYVIF